MSAGLNFSLVSPERELYAGDAQSVLVPGTEGLFQVGPGHTPIMSTLSPGFLVISQDGGEQRYYVRGGFADVTAAGLTILAEVAIPEAELKGDVLAAEKANAEAALAVEDAPADDVINAQRAVDVLSAVA